MSEAFVPDPNSPQAQAAWMASVDRRIAIMKQGSAIMVPGYAVKTSGQAGLAAGTTDITSLTVTVVIGTKRLIKITCFVAVQKHVTKSALQLYIRDSSNNVIGVMPLSVDGTTDDYATMVIVAVDKPIAGSKTYKASMFVNNGTCDIIADSQTQCYLLAEDVGLAPA